MREVGSRASKLARDSEDGTAISVEASPDGNVLLLITSPGFAQPAVFGFDPGDAVRFATTIREAAQEALAMRSKVVL